MRYDNEQLVTIAQAHEDSARSHSKSVQADSEKLWQLYRREPYGDEIAGRSQYVAGDVQGTVDWTEPDLLRLFMDGGIVAGVEEKVPNAEAQAKQEEQYSNMVFLQDNDGYSNLRDYIKHGLIGKRGYLGTWWEGPKLGAAIQHTGLTAEQINQIAMDESLQIDEETIEQIDGVYGPTFNLTAHRVNYDGCIKVEAVNPKNVLVSKDAEDEDDADYVAIVRQVNRSDLIEQFPDKRADIEELGVSESEELAHAVEVNVPDVTASLRTHDLLDEYIRLDLNGDGVNELVNIKRVDKLILSIDEVDEQPLASWSSKPEPGKFFASSLAESAAPSQRVRTVAKRQALDSVRLATTPRWMANKNVNMNDLLNVQIGAIIRTNGNTAIGNDIAPVTMPDVSVSALSMAEQEEQEREFTTGINRQSQGLDPDTLTDTFGGMQLLQNAASSRKEVLARECANGLKKCFEKIINLLRRHHDFKRDIKTEDGWAKIDPRLWMSETRIVVDVGVGTGSREAQMGRLTMIAQQQEKVLSAYGPENPLVGLQEIFETGKRMLEVAGFSATDMFLKNPQEFLKKQAESPPEPKPSPEEIKVQAQIQADQMKLQAQQQFDMQKLELERQKNEAELQLKRDQLDAELELKRQQMALMGSSQIRLGGRVG